MIVNQGEVREVGIAVTSKIGQPFTIDTAEYTVISQQGDEIESGLATIDGYKVLTLFRATIKGNHMIVFRYAIDSEILIAKIKIGVV